MFELYLLIFQKLSLPKSLAVLSWPVIPFVAVAALMVGCVLFLVLFERKLLAFFTVRKGPNRVGPWGLFQTIADAIKLLFKEDIISSGASKILFSVAPIIFFFPAMVVYGLIPFNQHLVAINASIGLYLFMAVLSISVVGILFAGWSSNNKYSMLGSMRAVLQAISYELPLVLSAMGVVVLAQSMDLNKIVLEQSGGLFSWNIWIGFMSFAVFFVCSLAEINRVPFDLPEAESELVSGYNTEYSGMKFALFFLAEYALLFILSALIATLFFGGYSSAFGVYISNILFVHHPTIALVSVFFEQLGWLFLKIFLIIFLIIWIRATLPRFRATTLMSFCWKFLLPLSVLNLLFLAVFKFFAG